MVEAERLDIDFSSHNTVLGVLGVVHVENYTKMQRAESSYLIHEISNIIYASTNENYTYEYKI